MLKSQNILDAWVLVWGDDVAVLQPDDIRQWVSNGFDSQFNQSALLHTDVPQFLSELWTHQGFLGWKRKLNESKPIPQHFSFWKKLQVERIWSCIFTINSESDGDGCASSSVLSHHSPLPGVLWQSWDDDQGLSAILFNHDLVGVVTNYLLPWEEDSWMACEINKFCSNSFWRFPLCCTHHCGTSTSQALVCPQPSGQIWQFVPQNIYMMKASWQKQACRVFLAEPHQSHLADEQENVQVNDWENGQVSGSESEEMWTWESINPCHFPYRQCSLFQALWMSLLFKKSFTWSSALLAVVWIAEVLLFHMAPHRASQNWQHYPSCWWQTRCTRLHLRVSLQAGEGWPVHPEEPLFGNGLQP